MSIGVRQEISEKSSSASQYFKEVRVSYVE